MVKILMRRFSRVAEAFDTQAAAKVRLCESSSGSEHDSSAAAAEESLTDLSELVNSFLEREISDHHHYHHHHPQEKKDEEDDESNNNECFQYENKDVLKNLVISLNCKDDVEKSLLEMVRDLSSLSSSPSNQRQLMTQLRSKGLDAGLCKSKWEKNGECPSGVYEYIDVMVDGARYIVEVSLAVEFEIARPTCCYPTLLEAFPPIFVGKEEEMKKVVKIMCTEMRRSMKAVGIHVPPWRRAAYMQAKWSSAYKRTTTEAAAAAAGNATSCANRECRCQVSCSKRRLVGFTPVAVPVTSHCCKEDFATGRKKQGNLAMAINE